MFTITSHEFLSVGSWAFTRNLTHGVSSICLAVNGDVDLLLSYAVNILAGAAVRLEQTWVQNVTCQRFRD